MTHLRIAAWAGWFIRWRVPTVDVSAMFSRRRHVLLILALVATLLGIAPASAQVDEMTMQAGVITVEQANPATWYSVTFDDPFDDVPVVVMGPVDQNGSQPAMMRVRNVTTTGFDYQLEEWDYLDGYHLEIDTAWLAVTQGWQEFYRMRMFATTVELDHNWQTVDLGFTDTPVVFAQVASENDAAAATVRTRNVSGASVQLRLQEEEGADGTRGVETVHVIAVDEGNTTASGIGITVGRTGDEVTHAWHSVSGRSRNVVGVLAGMQTFDGGDTAALRTRSITDSGFDVFIQEETSANSETAHTTEVVGWMMISAGR